MAASTFTVIVEPWVQPYVALMIRCGVEARARQAVVDFVWQYGVTRCN